LKKKTLNKRNNSGSNLWGAGAIFVGMFAVYGLLTDGLALIDPMIFPGWRKIIPAAFAVAPQLGRGLLSSLGLLAPALLGACLAGVGLGTIIGLNEGARRVLMPVFRALNPVPPTMLIPYTIAVFPTFWLSSASIIFIGAFWPVLMNTIHGILMLEPRWLDNARCLNLNRFKLVYTVVLPGAMPQIFAGVGSALIFSFILLTVAEMFGAKAGLGYFVQYYADFAEYDRVIAGMLFLSVVVIAIMLFFDRLQSRVLHWTRKR
jgi:NitT/TauT family transport system permease protein